MKETTDGLMADVAEPDATTLEDRVWRLEQVRAIEEVLPHYARCVDVHDSDGIAGMFTEHGALCNPGYPPIEGRHRIGKLYHRLLGDIKTSSHQVSGQQVRLVDDAHATVHAAFQSWDSYQDDAVPDCFSYGWYVLDLVREGDGVWRAEAMDILFAGQIQSDGSAWPQGRSCEQFDRPWPARARE